jgi:hypothetical protein
MLQWRELALTVKLTFKEKNTRFYFVKNIVEAYNWHWWNQN